MTSPYAAADGAAKFDALAQTYKLHGSSLKAASRDLGRAMEGETADALITVIRELPSDFDGAAEAFSLVARAIERFAGAVTSLEWEQTQAERDLRQIREADEGLLDVGSDWRELAAQRRLGAIRGKIEDEQRELADVIGEAARAAVRAEREAYERSPLGRIAGAFSIAKDAAGRVIVGLFEGTIGAVYGLGKLVLWDLTLQVVTDPQKWAENWEGMARFGLKAAKVGYVLSPAGRWMLADPEVRQEVVEFGSAVIDLEGLREDPARWLGNLGGTILLGGGLGMAGRSSRAAQAINKLKQAPKTTPPIKVVKGLAPVPKKPPAVQPTLIGPPSKLDNILKNLYKGAKNPDRIGDGHTADAVLNEAATGRATYTFHWKKAMDDSQGLRNWLRKHPDAPSDDIMVARKELARLTEALKKSGFDVNE